MITLKILYMKKDASGISTVLIPMFVESSIAVVLSGILVCANNSLSNRNCQNQINMKVLDQKKILCMNLRCLYSWCGWLLSLVSVLSVKLARRFTAHHNKHRKNCQSWTLQFAALVKFEISLIFFVNDLRRLHVINLLLVQQTGLILRKDSLLNSIYIM